MANCRIWLGSFVLLVASAQTSVLARSPMKKERCALRWTAQGDASRAARLAAQLARALDARKELSYVALHRRPGPELGRSLLVRSKAAIEAAKRAIRNLEIGRALKTLQASVAEFNEQFHRIQEPGSARSVYAQMLLQLAVAQLLEGQQATAEKTVTSALNMLPTLDFDRRRFPPAMRKVFDTARFMRTELGMGMLSVKVKPKEAKVFIDGLLVGEGGVSRRSVHLGAHLVSVVHPGYVSRTRRIDIQDPDQPAKIKIVLEARRAGLPDSAPKGACERCRRLATARRLDAIVFARIESGASGVHLALALYRTAADRVVARAHGSVGSGQRAVERLVAQLIGARAATTGPKKTTRAGPTWFGSRSFWWTLGGVAALAVVGTAIGVALHDADAARRRALTILPIVRY